MIRLRRTGKSEPEAAPITATPDMTLAAITARHSSANNADGFWKVAAVRGKDGLPDISFLRTAREGAPPELLELRNGVDNTLGALKLIYGRGGRKRQLNEAFAKLVSLAQLGLQGEKPKVSEANAALDSLQWEVVSREAGRIKNGYMKTLGLYALGFAIPTTLLYLILDRWPDLPSREIYHYRHLFLVLSGCMAGAWASFASRKMVLGFFDLAALEEDQTEPPLRLIFTAVLTTILVLIFTTGFADVRIGSFQASNVLHSGATAVLLGALSGLSEQALPAALMMRANAFIKAGEGK
ncbi:MAG: hypothetical protein M3Q08_18975 [Pseudomonadota bacterium]|nr:hypothetical protein [Pseudomonadota bacterium]